MLNYLISNAPRVRLWLLYNIINRSGALLRPGIEQGAKTSQILVIRDKPRVTVWKMPEAGPKGGRGALLMFLFVIGACWMGWGVFYVLQKYKHADPLGVGRSSRYKVPKRARPKLNKGSNVF